MNGVYNLLFLVIIFMSLAAWAYMYSIADIIEGKVHTITGGNAISDAAYAQYQNTRDLIFGATTGILIPFFVFLTFASSFINRNQDITGYLVGSMMVLLGTPVCIYLFSQILTNLFAVSILDPAYIANTLIGNFLWILVGNMLLSLASFVFIRKNLGVG